MYANDIDSNVASDANTNWRVASLDHSNQTIDAHEDGTSALLQMANQNSTDENGLHLTPARVKRGASSPKAEKGASGKGDKKPDDSGTTSGKLW